MPRYWILLEAVVIFLISVHKVKFNKKFSMKFLVDKRIFGIISEYRNTEKN